MEFTSVHQSNLGLVELMLQETGTFDLQFIRPYTAEVTADSLSRLENRIGNYSSQIPSGNVGSEMVSGLCSGLIAPAANVETPVNIINGWGERRFRFVLTIEEKSVFGSVLHYFQGYSEYFSLSYGDHIDPNMNFFINSYISVTRAMDPMNPGIYSDSVIRSKVLSDGRMVDADNHGLYTMRHPDLFAGLAKSYMEQAAPIGMVHDTRISNQGNMIIPIDRLSCGIPSHYLSNTIDAHRHAQMNAHAGFDSSSLFDRAYSISYESDVLENAFIRDLTSRFCPGSSFPKIDFTINNLLSMDPTFSGRISYTPVDDLGSLSQQNCFTPWDNRTIETRIASILSTSIPALMLNCGMVTVNFTSTNMTINGQPNSRMLSPGTTVNTVNQVAVYNNFLSRYEREIHPDISQMNQIPFSVTLAADIKNEVQIMISVAGGPIFEYRYPCFCDGLVQPVLSTNQENFNAMIAGVDEIINHTGLSVHSMLTNEIYAV